MAESYLSDHGDSIGSNTNSAFNSFFDWNNEMRSAKLSRNSSAPENNSILGAGAATEPDFIDFNDGTRRITQSTGRGLIEYINDSEPGERVVYTNDIANDHQTFQYDRAPQNQERNTEEQERQEQTRQLGEAIQNFIKALVALSMLYSRWMQQNYAGGGNQGGDTGYGGYDRPTAGPDSGNANQDSDFTPAPRPVRPRPQPPAQPRNPRSDTANPGSGNTDRPSGSRYEDTGITRGRTIFRDDFNGERGERPNQAVFDTAHIGADGKTRQRGESIHEDGIISANNTVQDGEGHLQLFPVRQRTYDEVGKEYVNYTKGSMHTTNGLNFNLKDHPDGIAIEVRAKHPTRDGAKFNALWIMTERWAADPAKGERQGDTIEYDAAEGGGADIAIHYPTKGESGKSEDHYGGGAHPKDVNFNDGNFHTYTIVITPNEKTGRGDVVQYVDGKKEFAKENVFPGDKDLHLKASLEISPKWTHKTLTGPGGMNSDAAGVIDYIDVSELKKRS